MLREKLANAISYTAMEKIAGWEKRWIEQREAAGKAGPTVGEYAAVRDDLSRRNKPSLTSDFFEKYYFKKHPFNQTGVGRFIDDLGQFLTGAKTKADIYNSEYMQWRHNKLHPPLPHNAMTENNRRLAYKQMYPGGPWTFSRDVTFDPAPSGVSKGYLHSIPLKDAMRLRGIALTRDGGGETPKNPSIPVDSSGITDKINQRIADRAARIPGTITAEDLVKSMPNGGKDSYYKALRAGFNAADIGDNVFVSGHAPVALGGYASPGGKVLVGDRASLKSVQPDMFFTKHLAEVSPVARRVWDYTGDTYAGSNLNWKDRPDYEAVVQKGALNRDPTKREFLVAASPSGNNLPDETLLRQTVLHTNPNASMRPFEAIAKRQRAVGTRARNIFGKKALMDMLRKSKLRF